MSLINYLLKKVIPIPKVLDCNSFAFIGAHPDDIESGCGGTVAKLVKMKKKVVFIIVTDGRYGTMDYTLTTEKIIEIRKNEAIAAGKLLGVTDIRFLDFSDGGHYDVEQVADKITIELLNTNPEMVFTIDNHVKSEIHPDHLQVGRASELAFFRCSFPLMMKELGLSKTANPKGIGYYFTDCPNTFINVSKTFNEKILSLKEHKSQFLSGDKGTAILEDIIRHQKFNGIRCGIRKLCRYGEGFRVLSAQHLHCIPESSNF